MRSPGRQGPATAKREEHMNIIVYAGMAYLLTAVIAFAVTAVIVGISRFMSTGSDAE